MALSVLATHRLGAIGWGRDILSFANYAINETDKPRVGLRDGQDGELSDTDALQTGVWNIQHDFARIHGGDHAGIVRVLCGAI